jgi:hypothetical protein
VGSGWNYTPPSESVRINDRKGEELFEAANTIGMQGAGRQLGEEREKAAIAEMRSQFIRQGGVKIGEQSIKLDKGKFAGDTLFTQDTWKELNRLENSEKETDKWLFQTYKKLGLMDVVNKQDENNNKFADKLLKDVYKAYETSTEVQIDTKPPEKQSTKITVDKKSGQVDVEKFGALPPEYRPKPRGEKPPPAPDQSKSQTGTDTSDGIKLDTRNNNIQDLKVDTSAADSDTVREQYIKNKAQDTRTGRDNDKETRDLLKQSITNQKDGMQQQSELLRQLIQQSQNTGAKNTQVNAPTTTNINNYETSGRQTDAQRAYIRDSINPHK